MCPAVVLPRKVQPAIVGERLTGLALQQVLRLESRDMRDGGKHIRRVRRRTLDAVSTYQLLFHSAFLAILLSSSSFASSSSSSSCQFQVAIRTLNVPMVNTPLASFMVHIKVLQIVVKVDAARTKVPTEQGSMGGKDGRHVDMPLAAQGDGETGLPFVEMGNDGRVCFARAELSMSAGSPRAELTAGMRPPEDE